MFSYLYQTDLSRKDKSDLVRMVCSDREFQVTLKTPNLLSDSGISYLKMSFLLCFIIKMYERAGDKSFS